jgi:hypothetical protein
MTACQKNALDVSGEIRSAVPSGYTVCGTATETAILAGQSTNVGSVTVWNDENNVYVLYEATGDYKFRNTHLYVGSCSDIPVNNAGNPRIGLYPYNDDHGNTGVSSFLKTIPINSLNQTSGCLCVSAHSEVIGPNFSQTGWGQGAQINDGGSWAMKFDYCIQTCSTGGGPGDR